MNLNTTFFGEIDIDKSQVIHFQDGLPGFEDMKDFVILNNYDTDDPVPFMWLQSTQDSTLAFVVTIPFFMRPDYEFEIPNDICSRLDLKDPSQAGIYSICKIGGSIDSMTVNLRSPIIVNVENKQAVQLVLTDTRYSSREFAKK